MYNNYKDKVSAKVNWKYSQEQLKIWLIEIK